MEGPRETRIDEFEELMDLLCESYGYENKDWFLLHYPHIYSRDPQKLKIILLLKKMGK